MTDSYTLGTSPLSLSDVLTISRSRRRVAVDKEVRRRLSATREFIESRWMNEDAPLIYSFNTGVGAFKNTRISVEDIAPFQTNLILAHATGIGPDLAPDVVRAMMLLRLNAFMSDYSGVSLAVVDRLVDFLNHDLIPSIPAQGSVGASGDLAPLAHMAGALCGFENAFIYRDKKRLAASEALTDAGLPPGLDMQAKDASALINGSTASLAIATLAIMDACSVAKNADIALSLSLEAMRCEKDAFIPEIHAARPHPGQQLVARNVMRLTEDSRRMSEQARALRYPGDTRPPGADPAPRVQDTYSLRCAPQVHGPMREALDYISGIVEREINSATDNPLIVEVEGVRRAVSGGHFHGQYIAQAMDLLAMVMTDVSSICERRVARLIDPAMSHGLAPNLASGKPGLNTGYSTVQCSLSALVMENRTLSTPGSIDSIPGKGNAEDHVSNSTWCARKGAMIVSNTRMIVAGEILLACQALSSVASISKDFPLATATNAVLETVRESIPYRDQGDVWYAEDMHAALSLVENDSMIQACTRVVGQIE